MADKAEAKKELVHEPVKGYRTAFYIIVAIAVLYLMYIFINSFAGMPP